MRKYRRNVAKHNMIRKGLSRINKKHGKLGTSFFADHWREYCK